MNTTSSPASYRYWTSLTSVWTRGNFSPARNVLSTTAPESRFFNRVRTNAPPFPGFTCWNSTIRQTESSIEMCIPLRNWFVLTVSAIGAPVYSRRLLDCHELLRERAQEGRSVVSDRDEILDAHTPDSHQVDPGLDRDHIARGQRVRRRLREPWRLVDSEADAVAEPVAEVLAEPGFLDHVAGDGVDFRARLARAQRLYRLRLRVQTDV